MMDALARLPAYLRRRLARALESGVLSPPFTATSLHSTVGVRDEKLAKALTEWERLGVSGAAAAAWLRSLDQASSRVAPAKLVWTGPDAEGLHSRATRQVYEEMIATARRSILISTFAYFDGPQAFKMLADRMDTIPDLRVTLLLNIDRPTRSTTKASDLVLRFAERFWRSDWPGRESPSVYYDPRSLELGGPRGVLHAKAVVTDEESLFVTSANLTQAAMDRNIEVGVLLRDRTIAQTAAAHFRGLIKQGLLVALPRRS